MKGLLLKDVCSMATEMKYIILLMVLMVFLGNDWLYTFIIVYASVLPISALGYDERAKWDKMANMLPFTSKQLVGSKYILGYLLIGIAALFAVFSKCIAADGAMRIEAFVSIAIAVCIAAIVEAVQLPLMFWIGVEKGRLLFVILTVSAASSMYSIMNHLAENVLIQTGSTLRNTLLMLLVLTAAVCNLVSFWISSKIYQRIK